MSLALAMLAGCASIPTVKPDDRAPAQAAQNVKSQSQPESQQCMALAMYWEARGEGRQGMQAVGAVILNRVADQRFPNTPCGVVYQGGETPPCQFSWWCDGRSDHPTQRMQWALALSVADDVLTGRAEDKTDGALFFHNTSIPRPWQRQQTAQIGNHIFYR